MPITMLWHLTWTSELKVAVKEVILQMLPLQKEIPVAPLQSKSVASFSFLPHPEGSSIAQIYIGHARILEVWDSFDVQGYIYFHFPSLSWTYSLFNVYELVPVF